MKVILVRVESLLYGDVFKPIGWNHWVKVHKVHQTPSPHEIGVETTAGLTLVQSPFDLVEVQVVAL